MVHCATKLCHCAVPPPLPASVTAKLLAWGPKAPSRRRRARSDGTESRRPGIGRDGTAQAGRWRAGCRKRLLPAVPSHPQPDDPTTDRLIHRQSAIMVQYSTGKRSRQPAAPLSASDATSPTVSGIAAICDQVSLHLPRLAGRGGSCLASRPRGGSRFAAVKTPVPSSNVGRCPLTASLASGRALAHGRPGTAAAAASAPSANCCCGSAA